MCLFYFVCFLDAAGRDYTPVSKGQVDIPSRSTSRQCISINITHNNMMEGQRNFFVNWFLESGILPGVILENNVTNVTINDDDSKSFNCKMLFNCCIL